MRGYEEISYNVPNKWQDNMRLFIILLAVTATIILGFSFSIIVISSVNLKQSFSFGECTMANCINGKPDNELWTCDSTGNCVLVGYVPGLCTSDQNCTTYNSGVNFAFDSICYEDLSTCDVQLNSAMYSPQRELKKSKPWDVDYHEVQTQVTPLYLNIGLDIAVTTKSTSNRIIHHFPGWESNIWGNLMTLHPFPYELPIGRSLVKLDYNGIETDGIIDFSSDGFVRFFWVNAFDGNYTVHEEFNCNCEFYGIVIAYSIS
jgi:hypothetical protein